MTPAFSAEENVEDSGAASGKIQIVSRPDTEYLLLGVSVNGYTRDEGIDAYLPEEYDQTGTLVPLGAISKTLSYSIAVNPHDGTAEGWFVSEDNEFQLDLAGQQVIVSGKKIPLKPGDAEAHEDDIYVKADLLKEWFGFEIAIDMSELLLSIKSGEALPFEEQRKRLQDSKRKMKRYEFEAVKAENAALIPYKNASLPMLLFGQTTTFLSSPESQKILSGGSVQGNMDLLKFETDFNLAYQTNPDDGFKITTSRATLEKRDPSNSLLGVLKAGKVAIGDISFPTTPLFAGGQSGAGIAISSDSRLGFRYAGNPRNYVVEGDAPIDWDAELYRNGSFIDFQRIGANGRFEFRDLELINGYNLFQIILYGPEGQKKTVTREVFRGPYMVNAGTVEYDFAAGMPESDFMPFSDNSRDDRRGGMSGRIFYGVNNFLTLGTNFYTGPDGDKDASGGSFTAATSLWGIGLQGQTLFADHNRSAYEISASMRPLGFNIAASQTIFKNFLEDDQEITKATNITVYRNIKGVSISLSGEQREFLNREKEFAIDNIISADAFSFKFTNDLSRIISDDPTYDDFFGEFSIQRDILNFRMRGALTYSLDDESENTIRMASLSGQRNLNKRTTLRMAANYDFVTKVTSGDARLSREFSKFGLDLNLNANDESNYSFTVGFRAALQPDEFDKYHFVDPQRGAMATLGTRAYIDINSNRVFDDGIDKPIPGVLFISSHSSEKAITNEEGIAWIHGLVEMPTRVKIQANTIPDIYLAPLLEHIDLIPRRGTHPILEFPFAQLGEVEGYIQLDGTEEGVGLVGIRLINPETGDIVDETVSEEDGYFIFSSLKAGAYKILASAGWFDEKEADTITKEVNVVPDLSKQEQVQISVSKKFVDLVQEQSIKEMPVPDGVALPEKIDIIPE